MKNFRNRWGFSLIEIVMAVAIVGILATLATNSYSKYRLNSKRTQIKFELAKYYSAQKSFHVHFNTYFNDFRNIGYEPEGVMPFVLGTSAVQHTSVPNIAHPTCPASYGGPGVTVGQVGVQIDNTIFCGASPKCTYDATFGCGFAQTGSANVGYVDVNAFEGQVCMLPFKDARIDSFSIDQNQNIIHILNANP